MLRTVKNLRWVIVNEERTKILCWDKRKNRKYAYDISIDETNTYNHFVPINYAHENKGFIWCDLVSKQDGDVWETVKAEYDSSLERVVHFV